MPAQVPALVFFLAVIALGLGAGRCSKTPAARVTSILQQIKRGSRRTNGRPFCNQIPVYLFRHVDQHAVGIGHLILAEAAGWRAAFAALRARDFFPDGFFGGVEMGVFLDVGFERG